LRNSTKFNFRFKLLSIFQARFGLVFGKEAQKIDAIGMSVF